MRSRQHNIQYRPQPGLPKCQLWLTGGWSLVYLACLYASAPLVLASSEFGSLAHPYLGLLLLTALVLGLRCAAFIRDLDFDRALMALVVKAMRDADLSHKEAHLLMGYMAGQWSEIVSCQRPAPSLSRLIFLPKAFWKAFIWDFSSLVIAHKVQALAADERKVS